MPSLCALRYLPMNSLCASPLSAYALTMPSPLSAYALTMPSQLAYTRSLCSARYPSTRCYTLSAICLCPHYPLSASLFPFSKLSASLRLLPRALLLPSALRHQRSAQPGTDVSCAALRCCSRRTQRLPSITCSHTPRLKQPRTESRQLSGPSTLDSRPFAS